jgi:hypothetical protein
VHAFQVSPSPSPTNPVLTPIAPQIDTTWLVTGFFALVCLLVAGVFLYMLVQNIRGLGSVSPWQHVAGLVLAIAGMIILGIISSSTMWEPLKPLAATLTGPGVVLILIVIAVFAVVNS